MRERPRPAGGPLINKMARVAYAFLVMNYSAIAALVAVVLRKKVWH